MLINYYTNFSSFEEISERLQKLLEKENLKYEIVPEMHQDLGFRFFVQENGEDVNVTDLIRDKGSEFGLKIADADNSDISFPPEYIDYNILYEVEE